MIMIVWKGQKEAYLRGQKTQKHDLVNNLVKVNRLSHGLPNLNASVVFVYTWTSVGELSLITPHLKGMALEILDLLSSSSHPNKDVSVGTGSWFERDLFTLMATLFNYDVKWSWRTGQTGDIRFDLFPLIAKSKYWKLFPYKLTKVCPESPGNLLHLNLFVYNTDHLGGQPLIYSVWSENNRTGNCESRPSVFLIRQCSIAVCSGLHVWLLTKSWLLKFILLCFSFSYMQALFVHPLTTLIGAVGNFCV